MINALIRVATTSMFPLAFAASFQITLTDPVGMDILAVTVLVLCVLFIIFGINVVFNAQMNGCLQEAIYQTKYGPFYNDFNTWNLYFFVVLLSKNILIGTVISSLKNRTVWQSAAVTALHLMTMCLAFACQPFASYQDAVFVVLIMFLQGLQSIIAIVLALESIDATARDVFAVASVVIANIVLLFNLLLLLFRLSRAVYRYSESRVEAKEDGQPLETAPVAEQHDSVNLNSEEIIRDVSFTE
jgi:hypothetical protein